MGLIDQVAEPLSAPMLEFLEWVRFRPRTYADAMAAWGTVCPRFTEWEDALDLALIEVEPGGSLVCLTPEGRAALQIRDLADGRFAREFEGV